MAKLNTKQSRLTARTHEGAPTAPPPDAEARLRRSVMACMLWEKSFYEDGEAVADRIKDAVPHIHPQVCAEIAIEARMQMKLRHVPLLIAREMARSNGHRSHVKRTLGEIIQRPDELTEFLAIYWKDGKQPLANSVKRGLAQAFTKFDEYRLAKYNRDGAVKLRDVLFLSHAKPQDKAQERLWKRLIDGKLAVPDTWEVELSAGKDKKSTWERLMLENKLGGLALLRNLRNMTQVRVDEDLIEAALDNMSTSRILPYRFIAAARYAPNLEPRLEGAMLKCIEEREKLRGATILLVDVSGSMDDSLSPKSDMTRLDAACGLAIILREVCEKVFVVTFSNSIAQIPPRRGFALRDSIVASQPHSGTYLGKAIQAVNGNPHDRMIVITDEQSHDRVGGPNRLGYMINVASYENGVSYGPWTHITGWSESIVDYIIAKEESCQEQKRNAR